MNAGGSLRFWSPRLSRGLVRAVAALPVLAACADIHPIETADRTVIGAGLPDSGLILRDSSAGEENDSGEVDPCAACIGAPNTPGPGCANELAVCETFSGCPIAINCAVDNGCFAKPSDKVIECGVPCGEIAHIADPNSTEGSATIAVALCTIASCSAACGAPVPQ